MPLRRSWLFREVKSLTCDRCGQSGPPAGRLWYLLCPTCAGQPSDAIHPDQLHNVFRFQELYCSLCRGRLHDDTHSVACDGCVSTHADVHHRYLFQETGGPFTAADFGHCVRCATLRVRRRPTKPLVEYGYYVPGRRGEQREAPGCRDLGNQLWERWSACVHDWLDIYQVPDSPVQVVTPKPGRPLGVYELRGAGLGGDHLVPGQSIHWCSRCGAHFRLERERAGRLPARGLLNASR